MPRREGARRAAVHDPRAGFGRSREDFERDARYLTRTWDEVRAVASRERAPALLHHEPSLVQRLLRDILSDEIASIRLDNDREFQKTLDLVTQLQPELSPRVRLHARGQNILEEHGVSTELERALRSKVWLASGGYIVINQTEALVAIDVNTGRFVGKKGLEDTILRPTWTRSRRSSGRSDCGTSAGSSSWISSTWRSARAARRSSRPSSRS